MDTATHDSRIEAFRTTLERLDTINCQLQTLAITLARAEELPSVIARTLYPYDRQLLSEEQAAIGHPLRLRIRQSQLETEFRQGWVAVDDRLQAALDAAAQLVTTAAGGPSAAQALPVARINLEQLARHRTPPAAASTTARFAFFRQAWTAIDTAMASLGEIRFEMRQRAPGFMNRHTLAATPIANC